MATLHVIAEAIRGKLEPVDISALSAQIEALLDERVESMAITAPIIPGGDRGGRVNLTEMDFAKLAKLFRHKPKTAAEKLCSAAEGKAQDLASRNPTRVHLVEKLVDAYNLGTLEAEAFLERAAPKDLTEEELAIFNLLTRPKPELTKAQEAAVKKIARDHFRLPRLGQRAPSVEMHQPWSVLHIRTESNPGRTRTQRRAAKPSTPSHQADRSPDSHLNDSNRSIWALNRGHVKVTSQPHCGSTAKVRPVPRTYVVRAPRLRLLCAHLSRSACLIPLPRPDMRST